MAKVGQLSNPSHVARRHFFNFLGNQLSRYKTNIVAGDFNHVPDHTLDKIWIKPPPTTIHLEDREDFNNKFIYQLELMDTYMNSYDEASGLVAMTHKSNVGTSFSRLDRILFIESQ